MVKLLLIFFPVIALSIYPYLDHPPIFLFEDGFVLLDVQTSRPSTLDVLVKIKNDEFHLIDRPSDRHRLKIPVKENFDYHILVKPYEMSGSVVFPSRKLEDATILIYGDTRNDGKVQRKIVAFGKSMGADFLIHLGDIAYTDMDDGDWMRFFKDASNFGKVVFTVKGNHEFPGLRYAEYLYPSNYSFEIGDFNFVVLDGGTFPEILEVNLKKLLKKEMLNLLLIHEPFYTCSNHSSDLFVILQKKFARYLKNYGIRYVISSHDHNYQRIERNGLVQIILGGGGAPLYKVRKNCKGLEAFSENYSFAMMRIHKDEAQFRVYDISGKVIDSLVIKR